MFFNNIRIFLSSLYVKKLTYHVQQLTLLIDQIFPYWLIKSSFKFFVTWWVSKLLLFLTPATISFFFKDSLNNQGNSSFNLALYYMSHKEVVSPVPIKTLLLFKNNHMEPNIPFQK